jgi:mannose-6-phosphate isomerase-like protein (cupin superfamily)
MGNRETSEAPLRIILAAAVVGALSTATQAQPSQVSYAAPEDVSAAIARSKAATALKAETIVAVSPFHMSVEYRANSTPASLHEKNNELINVIEGSGTMIVGGALKNEKRRDESNLNGSGIDGGKSIALVKGSYVFIPAGMPHYFASVGKDGLTITTIYLPRP